jgi:ubiquinone/menaquinone biosynthesis C-methylase UbiE
VLHVCGVAQNCYSKEKEEIVMDMVESNLGFRLMAFGYKFRDLRLPRKDILEGVGIKPGCHVLDYGYGPGSYIVPLAELVGESGKVCALDIHPLAIQKVKDVASRKQLANVEAILSDYQTGLQDNSLDVVLLYDIFHHLSDWNKIQKELHRVLKPDGVLSFSDHHMKEDEIVSAVTNSGFFSLSSKGQRTYSFLKKQVTA